MCGGTGSWFSGSVSYKCVGVQGHGSVGLVYLVSPELWDRAASRPGSLQNLTEMGGSIHCCEFPVRRWRLSDSIKINLMYCNVVDVNSQ